MVLRQYNNLRNVEHQQQMGVCMKKLHILFTVILLVSSQAFATYLVVMKDGTRYRAKSKWTMSGGKAMIPLENGTTLQVDPTLIDTAKTNQLNAAGLGDVKVLAVEEQTPEQTKQVSPLGSMTKLRNLPPATATQTTPSQKAPTSPTTPEISVAPGGGSVDGDVISKFVAAYENTGLYDANVTSKQSGHLRVELTADNEDKVFKAISATAYMLVHVPQTTGVQLQMVELFMKTINGGSAGRFQMSSGDAAAIDSKQMKIENYFVNKVIF